MTVVLIMLLVSLQSGITSETIPFRTIGQCERFATRLKAKLGGGIEFRHACVNKGLDETP